MVERRAMGRQPLQHQIQNLPAAPAEREEVMCKQFDKAVPKFPCFPIV